MKENHFALTCFLIWIILMVRGGPEVRSDTSPASGLQITVSVPREKFPIGEDIPVSVKLLNVSGAEILVGRYLGDFKNAPSYLRLSVEDSFGHRSDGPFAYVEISSGLARKWWIEVPPGHFYGADTRLVQSAYPVLRTPGRLCITAIYSSSGEDEPGSSAKLLKRGEHFRRKAWTGKIRSNPTCIYITSSAIPPA